MRIVKTKKEIEKVLSDNKGTIGFVPTMGALHEGHMSLIVASKAKCDITIASIFVNPTQFNDPKDYEKYPLSMQGDIEMLEKYGCDILFAPTVETIYPKTLTHNLNVDLGNIALVMEGAHRPGHFDGVMQVVKKLLEFVEPSYLFLGSKDYQQCMVLEKMISHYQMPIKVVRCAIIREVDGLAMSSRNRLLNKKERKIALKLSKALRAIRKRHPEQSPSKLVKKYIKKLREEELIEVEYLCISDAQNLNKVVNWDAHEQMNAFIAAKVGNIRLIDNLAINY